MLSVTCYIDYVNKSFDNNNIIAMLSHEFQRKYYMQNLAYKNKCSESERSWNLLIRGRVIHINILFLFEYNISRDVNH